MHIPPGYLRWAAAGAGVVVLGVLVATAAGVAGAYGDAAPRDTGRTVQATVVTGVSCAEAGARETVAFTVAGKPHEAAFSGCGHAKDEPLAITLPPGPVTGNLVVHAADAAIGTGRDGAGLAPLLVVVSGVAGAGYAFLLRRGPSGKRLPKALRLV